MYQLLIPGETLSLSKCIQVVSLKIYFYCSNLKKNRYQTYKITIDKGVSTITYNNIENANADTAPGGIPYMHSVNPFVFFIDANFGSCAKNNDLNMLFYVGMKFNNSNGK